VKGPLIPGAEKVISLSKEVATPEWWTPEVLVMIGDENGKIILADDKDEVALAKCNVCGQYWFMPWGRSFACRNCGAYDGDHHIARTADQLNLAQILIKPKSTNKP